MWINRLGAKEHPLDVYAHHAVPFVRRDFEERLALETGVDCGIIDEDIDAAVGGYDLPDHGLNRGFVRHVDRNGQRAPQGGALAVAVDVSDEASVQAMVGEVVAAHGGVDILVNNAAIYAGLKRKPFFEITADEWDRVMSVNVKGVFLCAKAVYPHLKGRGGKIVNIASATVF